MSEIREARIARGLTQLQLAKLIGVNNNLLSQWERGRKYPSKQSRDKIRAVLPEIKFKLAPEDYYELDIRKERKARGLTLNRLATLTGLRRVTIKNWESRRSLPYVKALDTLKKFFESYPVLGSIDIKAERKKRFISQTELARTLGVTPQSILNWENRKKAPQRKHLEALKNIFESYPVLELFDVKTEREKRFIPQAELARASGVTPRTIRKWENRKNVPQRKHLEALKNIFESSLILELFDVKTEREKRFISQTELARTLGVNPQTIRKWEKQKSMPQRKHLEALKNIFESSPILELFDVKTEREKRFISRADLARALGVTLQAIRKWESKKAVPSEKYRDALKKIFDETPVSEYGRWTLSASEIREERLKRGLSQKQLAKRINLCPVVVMEWERERQTPTPESMKRLLKAFSEIPVVGYMSVLDIKKERLRRRLSQEDLAKAIGVSRIAISTWEQQRRIPCPENLSALAKLFAETPIVTSKINSAKSPESPKQKRRSTRNRRRSKSQVQNPIKAYTPVIKIPDIREMREARGLTQKFLAESLGATIEQVEKWESKKAWPSFELLSKIKEFFLAHEPLPNRESSAKSTSGRVYNWTNPDSSPYEHKMVF